MGSFMFWSNDGSILGRGQWNMSELVSIDALGIDCIAGAQNGDAVVGKLNQLEDSFLVGRPTIHL